MIILPRAISNGNPKFSLKVLDATLKKIKGIVCGFPLKRFDSIKKILQGILFQLSVTDARTGNSTEAFFSAAVEAEEFLLNFP